MLPLWTGFLHNRSAMIPEDASVPGQGRQSKVNRTASTFTHRHPSAGDGDGGPSDGGLSQLASFHKKKTTATTTNNKKKHISESHRRDVYGNGRSYGGPGAIIARRLVHLVPSFLLSRPLPVQPKRSSTFCDRQTRPFTSHKQSSTTRRNPALENRADS